MPENRLISQDNDKKWLGSFISELQLYLNNRYETADSSIDDKRKLLVFTIISPLGVLLIFIVAIVDYLQNHPAMALANILTGIVLIANQIHCLVYRRLALSIRIGVISISGLYAFAYMTGGVGQVDFVWLFTYPLLACYLLSALPGFLASLAMLLPVIINIFTGPLFPFIVDYDLNFELRFLFSYLVVATFSFIFLHYFEKNQQALTSLNESLEQTVQERTEELILNQKKLQQARKMEALGTLAGGVAHDLNNVLSGIVSYPELLLMGLDEKSPYYKPLNIIWQSGQKANDIVQDLLTLTRRGIQANEVVNLNEIIQSYLNSPEFDQLMLHSSGITVHTNLDKELPNLIGSHIHLRKTLMNLVSNAAEAQPDGGEIIISTSSQHFDKPSAGYKEIKAGDYVCLSVEDKGQGISSNQLERIFEPFYSTKKMGRSGTGLGMTVVWGTIQDHNGSIDIRTTPKAGTTFFLYFPATQKQLLGEQSHFSHEPFKGNGESILIVDDNAEQRLIAQHILKVLQYSPTTASSGEEAIEYVRNNPVDLILLDMIMDPGIDGLETYKKIIEINPFQKAVIASGFAEGQRLREVRELGVDQFIKKPYTIESICMAIHNELQKTRSA